MKLLFDQNLSYKLCSRLADLFPGSEQVRQLGLAQADDRTIWDRANTDGFTLVTQDSISSFESDLNVSSLEIL